MQEQKDCKLCTDKQPCSEHLSKLERIKLVAGKRKPENDNEQIELRGD